MRFWKWLRQNAGSVRNNILVSGAVLGSAILIMIPLVTGGGPGPGITCDSTLTTRAAVLSAMTSTASSGKTICVTAPITGADITTTTDMTTQARFIAQPDNMTINMVGVNFNGASKITLEGFDMPGGNIQINTAANLIDVRRNFIRDIDGDNAFEISSSSGTVTNTKIVGNYIRNINALCSSTCQGGYGVRGLGTLSNLSILYNTFDMNPGMSNADNEISGDTFELDVNTCTITGNDIKDVIGSPYDGSDPRNPHADGAMIWSGSQNCTLKDNKIVNTTGTLMSPDNQDMLFENNLIATASQQCVDSTQNGSSGNVVPLRNVWIRNTIEGCGTGGLHTNGTSVGARGQNQLQFNIIETLSCDAAGPSQYTVADHNLVDTNGCAVSGTNNLNFTPTFLNTVDYLPTNLPLGYETAGYRRAPLGHLELPDGV